LMTKGQAISSHKSIPWSTAALTLPDRLRHAAHGMDTPGMRHRPLAGGPIPPAISTTTGAFIHTRV